MTRANIRFYEQEGFICPERGKNNYRNYSAADAETLRKIKLLRQLGLPLDVIRRVQKGELDLDGVQGAIKAKTRTAKLRMRSRSAGSDEVTFELRLKSKYEHDLVEAVRTCAGVDSVNLVSYSGESIG